MDIENFEFPVTVYGNIEKYNDVLSKARLRVFYKYLNRNGTFITDEFAEKLLNSIKYAPVKGIYSQMDGDFLDHGAARDLGRIYGIVPENPNLAWEDHLDEDGVVRTYACVDVLIFTALYKEANEIIGKSQSMELFPPSLQYHQAVINGNKCIVFDEGSFLGLQVLGNNTEPCFEGASFYTLQSQIENIIYQIKNHGGTDMPVINFKLSDGEKFNAIWNLLNTEYNEEGNWTVSYSVIEVYDDYALVVNHENGEYERVYYTKNDENNMVEINTRKKCYVIDVTEQELNTINTLRALNGDTYELVSEVLTNAQTNADNAAEFSLKIEELTEQVSTLNQEKETLTNEVETYRLSVEEKDGKLAESESTISSLTEEVNSLKDYRLGIETKQKEDVIAEYASKLSEEILNSYKEKYSEYTVEELDMHLAYELKKTNTSVFSSNQPNYIPKNNSNPTGIAAVLSKYKK